LKRLPRILLILICLAAGFAAAKLVVPPREVWQRPVVTGTAAHLELPTTIFRVSDLLERDQLSGVDTEISDANKTSNFTRYWNRRWKIVRMIETQIDPDSWIDNGSPGPVRGIIRGVGDKLIVTQTPANTKAIEVFLESLRNASETKNVKPASSQSRD